MKQEIQTYGKQNLVRREYNKVKSYYVVNAQAQQLSQFTFYAPGIKRYKLSVGFILIGICVITPFTNFLIPGIYRWVVR